MEAKSLGWNICGYRRFKMSPPQFLCCNVFIWLHLIFIFEFAVHVVLVVVDGLHISDICDARLPLNVTAVGDCDKYQIVFLNHFWGALFYGIQMGLSFSLNFSSYTVLAIVYLVHVFGVVLTMIFAEMEYPLIGVSSASEGSHLVVHEQVDARHIWVVVNVLGLLFTTYLIMKACKYFKDLRH